MMRRFLTLVTLLVLAGAGVAVALPQQQGSVDLLNQSGAQWDGPGEAEGSSGTGTSIVGLGDVFHRGRPAVAIGAPEADPGGRTAAGSVYVVAGQTGSGPVDLTALAGRGYRIDGAGPGDQAGFALASLTLANGHPGLAVGAPYAGPSGRSQAGAVYVIDLTRLRGNIDLGTGSRAVVGVLEGAAACAESGYALAPGPVAGGRGTTLLVGAPGMDPTGCAVSKPGGPAGGNTGAAYLVAAGSLTRRVDLLRPGRGASRFDGAVSGDRTGSAVATVTGSSRLLIGAPYASPLGRAAAGAVYLVRAPAAGRVVSLASSGRGSTLFEGAVANDALGFALATTTGFLRGQSRRSSDVVLGAPQASPKSRREAGAVYVLAATQGAHVDLSGARPLIAGADDGDEAGYALAGLGSINGTGLPSLAIGAPFVNSRTGQGRIDNGAAYVVFGGGSPSLDLARLGGRGFVAFGARNSDEAGAAVAGVSGENADGLPDLLVGAPFAQNAFGSAPVSGGAVYGVFGWGTPALRYPRATLGARVGHRIRALVPAVRHTGRATFTVSPALPRGLSLSRPSGRISGTPRRVSPVTRYTVQMTDQAGIASAVVTIGVTR